MRLSYASFVLLSLSLGACGPGASKSGQANGRLDSGSPAAASGAPGESTPRAKPVPAPPAGGSSKPHVRSLIDEREALRKAFALFGEEVLLSFKPGGVTPGQALGTPVTPSRTESPYYAVLRGITPPPVSNLASWGTSDFADGASNQAYFLAHSVAAAALAARCADDLAAHPMDSKCRCATLDDGERLLLAALPGWDKKTEPQWQALVRRFVALCEESPQSALAALFSSMPYLTSKPTFDFPKAAFTTRAPMDVPPADPTKDPVAEANRVKLQTLLATHCGACHSKGSGVSEFVSDFALVRASKTKMLARLHLPPGDPLRMPPTNIAGDTPVNEIAKLLMSIVNLAPTGGQQRGMP